MQVLESSGLHEEVVEYLSCEVENLLREVQVYVGEQVVGRVCPIVTEDADFGRRIVERSGDEFPFVKVLNLVKEGFPFGR